ncbi:MAG: AAA family ATPase [Acidobacteria bacterium]|nr:AAA family ATPase [Acidobacteriota bacterium]
MPVRWSDNVRLTVHGFRSIRKLTGFPIRPLNVIIGANGSGKSNLLLFFQFLHAIGTQELGRFTGLMGQADSLLHFGAKTTPVLEFGLDWEEAGCPLSYWARLRANVQQKLVFEAEGGLYDDLAGSLGQMRDAGGNLESSFAQMSPGPLGPMLRSIAHHHFNDTSPQARMRRGSYRENYALLESDGGNLAAFLNGMRHENRAYYDRIVETVRLISPEIWDFDLKPSIESPSYVILSWRDRSHREMFGMDKLSDGTLRAIALCALLLQPPRQLPAVLCIDEPELGLHPHALDLIAGLIQSASVHSKIVIGTQSPILVSKFTPEDVVVVESVNGESRFERKSSETLERWLAEYSLGDLWEMNLLGSNALP